MRANQERLEEDLVSAVQTRDKALTENTDLLSLCQGQRNTIGTLTDQLERCVCACIHVNLYLKWCSGSETLQHSFQIQDSWRETLCREGETKVSTRGCSRGESQAGQGEWSLLNHCSGYGMAVVDVLFQECDNLTKENAMLSGHQNLRQKIQYHAATKMENNKLKEVRTSVKHCQCKSCILYRTYVQMIMPQYTYR